MITVPLTANFSTCDPRNS